MKYIKDDQVFHMTDLINNVLQDNFTVGVYPVSEKSLMDTGQWEEYTETLKILSVEEK